MLCHSEPNCESQSHFVSTDRHTHEEGCFLAILNTLFARSSSLTSSYTLFWKSRFTEVLHFSIITMTHKTLLFLGAGQNVGASSIALFKSKGYKIAAVARIVRADVKAHADMCLTADFSDPRVMGAIFEKVEQKLGVPNVVIYNRKS